MAGQAAGEIEVLDEVFGATPNAALIHQVVVGSLANRRQGTAKTKTRAEVSGGGAKPRPQKHTGRARAGSIRSPIWRGGGVTFGPSPRSYRHNTPKRMRRGALIGALSGKAAEGGVVVVENFAPPRPKTKDVVAALAALGAGASVLLVADGASREALRAARNIPRLKTAPSHTLNALDLLNHRTVIMTVEAVRGVESVWGGKKRAAVVDEADDETVAEAADETVDESVEETVDEIVADAETVADDDSVADDETVSDAETDADAESVADAEAVADTEQSVADTESVADAEMDADDENVAAEIPDADAASVADAEAVEDAESVADAETAADAEQSETDSDAESDADAEAVADTEQSVADAESVLDAEMDADDENVADAETVSDTENAADAETVADAEQPDADAKPDAESNKESGGKE